MSLSKNRRTKISKARRAVAQATFEPLEDRQLLSCVIDTRIAASDGGGKSINVTNVGQVVHLEVWAVITGTDADGSNDGFQSVVGSFLSTSTTSGSVLGNMSSAVLSPFTGAGAQNGTPADLDGDGDLDIGSNDSNNFPPYFNARAGSVVTSGGVVSGATQSFEIGTINFVVTNLKSGTGTDINFRERGDDGFTGGALWGEDGKFTDSLTGNYSVGAPVVISDSSIVPTGQTVSGEVYNDANGNGALNTGETGVSNVALYIDSNNDGVMEGTEPQALTDTNGNYSFTGITAGAYIVRQILPAGATQTAPSGGQGQHITVTAGKNLTGVNFGDTVSTVATGETISGEVYKDANSNGNLDSTETGISNVIVYIDANNNGVMDSSESHSVTSGSGSYSFTNVKAGTYVIRQQVPAGDTQTAPASNAGQTVTVGSANIAGVNFGDSVPVVVTGQTISGEIYKDANANGKLDAGETGLGSVVVYIDTNNTGAITAADPQTSTDTNGNYSFSGLKAGAYIVRQVLPSGDKQITPSGGLGQHVTVTAGKNVTGVNFGDSVPVVSTGQTIGGEIYHDSNANGKLDAGETGLAGIVVYIDTNNTGAITGTDPQTMTDSNGNYSFTGIKAGAYIVRQVLPSGDKQTAPSGGLGQHVTVTAGKNVTGVNFGDTTAAVVTGQTITGEIYKDTNGNGKLDSGETGLGNVTVYIDSNNDGKFESGEPTTTTNSSTGIYTFSGIKAGAYIIRQTLPSGFKQTAPSGGLGQHVTVTSGSNLSGINFGDATTATPTSSSPSGGTITGEIFSDTNGNGKIDAGETGIANVTVYLDLNNNGIMDSSDSRTTTDTSGIFIFSNLTAGTYIVRQSIPSGYTQTSPTNNFGNHVTVASGQTLTGDFGDKPATAKPAVLFSSTAINPASTDNDLSILDWATA